MQFDRSQSWTLLCQYTKNEGLRKHALAVEAAMGAYARKLGQDVQRWQVVGLLHDFDYEQYPSEHPQKGEVILKDLGYDHEVRRAILSHAETTGVEPHTQMEKVLRAVDELVGLIIAVALIKPSKRLADVDLRSIKKKWKDKAFAKGVDRQAIETAVENLGVGLDDHIVFVLGALTTVAEDLGL